MKNLVTEIEESKASLLQRKLLLIEEMLLSGELIIFDAKANTIYESVDFEKSTPICINGNAIQINLGMID